MPAGVGYGRGTAYRKAQTQTSQPSSSGPPLKKTTRGVGSRPDRAAQLRAAGLPEPGAAGRGAALGRGYRQLPTVDRLAYDYPELPVEYLMEYAPWVEDFMLAGGADRSLLAAGEAPFGRYVNRRGYLEWVPFVSRPRRVTRGGFASGGVVVPRGEIDYGELRRPEEIGMTDFAGELSGLTNEAFAGINDQIGGLQGALFGLQQQMDERDAGLAEMNLLAALLAGDQQEDPQYGYYGGYYPGGRF